MSAQRPERGAADAVSAVSAGGAVTGADAVSAGDAVSAQRPERGAGDATDGPVVARVVYRAHVEWMDTDASGHHHNTAVTRYVEAAEAQLVRERGMPEYFGVAPRVRYEVEFPAKLWFGQPVTTTLVLERVGTSSLTFRFEVWGEQYEKHPRALAARGRYVTVYVPRGSDRGEPWPQDWHRRLTVAPPAPRASSAPPVSPAPPTPEGL
jgi:acyl-CoA thioester hydrolase